MKTINIINIKEAIKMRLPHELYAVITQWNRSRCKQPHELRCDLLYTMIGRPTQVAAGPFQGMIYHDRAICSMVLPKLLGTYELELIPVIEEIIAIQPSLIVDIGSAEGYYAVGLARRLPQTSVFAYDTDLYAQRLTSKLAVINGVAQRITVRGTCESSEIDRIFCDISNPVIICDCEGFEDELLDPLRAPALAKATILVEMHEFARPGVSSRIRSRFASTHVITTFHTIRRKPSDCTINLPLSEDDVEAAIGEYRNGPMEWDYMRPILQKNRT